MSKSHYKDLGIYWGCKRVTGASDAEQPKNIKREWFVYYHYLNPETGVYKRFKEKGGINRVHVLKDRITEARALRQAILEMLEEGYNPYSKTYFKDDAVPKQHYSLRSAVQFALQHKKLKRSSLKMYNEAATMFLKQAAEIGVSMVPIEEIKRRHIKSILFELKRKRGYGNTRHNSIMGCMSSLFSEMVEWDVIEYNVMLKMRRERPEDPKKFRALTHQEKHIIREKLPAFDFGFCVYSMMIYHTGIRRTEGLHLPPSAWLRKEKCILVNKEHSKTNLRRIVPVPRQLEALLEEYFNRYLPDGADESWFMFGRGFRPSQQNMHPATASRWWRTFCESSGLGNDAMLYNMKYTGGDDKLIAGIDVKAVQVGFGHTTEKMTERYVEQIKQIRANEIREKSPDF